jgi:hypothetical protein
MQARTAPRADRSGRSVGADDREALVDEMWCGQLTPRYESHSNTVLITCYNTRI